MGMGEGAVHSSAHGRGVGEERERKTERKRERGERLIDWLRERQIEIKVSGARLEKQCQGYSLIKYLLCVHLASCAHCVVMEEVETVMKWWLPCHSLHGLGIGNVHEQCRSSFSSTLHLTSLSLPLASTYTKSVILKLKWASESVESLGIVQISMVYGVVGQGWAQELAFLTSS